MPEADNQRGFPAKFRGRGFSEQDGAMFSQTRLAENPHQT